MLLDSATAHAAIHTISLLLLATALASMLLHRLESFALLLVLQGALLAAAAGVVALGSPSLHGYVAFLVTALVKPIAVPLVLIYALRRDRHHGGAESVISRKLAFLLAVALVLLAFYVAAPIARLDDEATASSLPSAVSLVLLGLFTMITRKKALAQVVGLVMLENGIYLAALVVTRGLPLAVELGVAVDILVGVLMMGLIVQQIQRTFETVDTDHLRTLRG